VSGSAQTNVDSPRTTGADRVLAPTEFEQPTVTARIEKLDLPPEGRAELIRLVAEHDYKSAERRLLALIGQHPKPTKLLVVAAGVFFLDHDFLNTAIALKKADAIQPLDSADRLILSLAYIALKRSEWARPELERLVRLDPASALYLYWLARIDYDDRRYLEAVSLLRRVVALAPRNARAYDNLALALEGTGELDEATRQHEVAVRLNRLQDKPSPWPALNYATLLVRIGKYREAETLIGESLQYDRALSQAHFRLGFIYDRERRHDEAIAELKLAIALDPNYSEPLYALTRIYYQQGDRASAQSTLAQFYKVRAAERAR
jgi:tetratricopeptide (TPR) repeat protein